MTFKRPISIYRQRVLEALVFFAEKRKIRNPSKMMMYKLLAEFDFRHFQETGIPVTNLRYEAFPWGPVPQPLHDEITQDNKLVLPEDFIDALTVQDTFFEDEKGGKHFGFKFIAKRKSNNRIFSPRQQNILQDVALIFKEATATEASMASHEPNKPWTITVARHGLKSTIDLVETLEVQKPLTKEVAAEMLRERNAILHNYGEQLDFRRGEILYDPSFVYPDANEICDKLLLVINKSHSDPDDVVIVPCKTNIRNFQFPPGCNEHDRMFFFEKQIGFYKANTILQLWAIDSKPCDYFDDMIAKKRIDRLNKFTTQEELGRIINCLKRLKKDIPVYIQELIF